MLLCLLYYHVVYAARKNSRAATLLQRAPGEHGHVPVGKKSRIRPISVLSFWISQGLTKILDFRYYGQADRYYYSYY